MCKHWPLFLKKCGIILQKHFGACLVPSFRHVFGLFVCYRGDGSSPTGLLSYRRFCPSLEVGHSSPGCQSGSYPKSTRYGPGFEPTTLGKSSWSAHSVRFLGGLWPSSLSAGPQMGTNTCHMVMLMQICYGI